jgi:hypothetical protein
MFFFKKRTVYKYMCQNFMVTVSKKEDNTKQRTTQNKDMNILIPKHSNAKSYIRGLL